MLSRDAANISPTIFSLTRPGIEIMIDRIRGEPANHYTIVAVQQYERGAR